MKKAVGILSCLLFSVSLCFSQGSAGFRICGTVLDSVERKPVEGANVMLGKPGTYSIYQYEITGKDGRFEFIFTGDVDSLRITVSAFDMKMKTVLIPAEDTRVDICVIPSPLELQAAVVTYTPIKRRSDTLIYNVESFRSASDRTIGEVIGKMPGLSVAKSGNITYNGEQIGRFYIEGMDMMENRYGLAVNGIKAKDIAAVEVMEDHHHEKIYQDKGLPGRPAINLRLKEGVKGTWSGSLLAGLGYRPWMWDGGADAMCFGKNFQTFDTYKTNNTGKDDSYGMFPGAPVGAFSMLSVKRPTVPPFDTERYLDNNSHSVSANAISRIGEELTLRADVQYLHDLRRYEGNSSTIYHLAGEDVFRINENMYSSSATDKVSIGVGVEKNSKKFYLNDRLNFTGAWNRDYGTLTTDGDDVSQRMKHSQTVFSNDLQIKWTRKDFTWSACSKLSYTSSPGTLHVTPLLYDLFADSIGMAASGAGQDLAIERLVSSNTISGMYNRNKLNLFLTAGADLDFFRMDSGLYPLEGAGAFMWDRHSDKGFSNDIYRHDITLSLRPALSWSEGDFKISASLPVYFKDIRFKDALHGKESKADRVYVNPHLNARYKITYELSLEAFAAYNENYGGLYDNYYGYIMTDYRNVSRREGDISVSRNQIYTLGVEYSNTVAALFLNAGVSYGRNWRNQTYSASYDGTLTVLESVPEPSASGNLGVSADISKRFFEMHTTVKLSGDYMRSWQRLLRQGFYYPMTYSSISGGIELLSDFSRWCTAEYHMDVSRSMTSTSAYGVEPSKPIVNLRQKLLLRIMPVEGLFLELRGEHYYNNGFMDSESMFYLDASASYKWRKFEFMLELGNLLNTKQYRNSVFSDVTTYAYSYRLRPLSAMLKVRIDL